MLQRSETRCSSAQCGRSARKGWRSRVPAERLIGTLLEAVHERVHRRAFLACPRVMPCCNTPHYVATSGNKWQHALVRRRPSSHGLRRRSVPAVRRTGGCAQGDCVRSPRLPLWRACGVAPRRHRSALQCAAASEHQQRRSACRSSYSGDIVRYRVLHVRATLAERTNPDAVRAVPRSEPERARVCGRQVAAWRDGFRVGVHVRAAEGAVPSTGEPEHADSGACTSFNAAGRAAPSCAGDHRRAHPISAAARRVNIGGAHGFQPSARARA